MTRRRGGAGLGTRATVQQLVAQPGLVTVLILTVLVASVLLTGIARLLEVASAEDLVATAVTPGPAQRNIRVEVTGQIASGSSDDPMSEVAGHGDRFSRSQIPSSVAAVISDQTYLADSPRFGLSPVRGDDHPPNPYPLFIRFRLQEGIDDHLTLVSGEMPYAQEPVEILVGSTCPDDPTQVQSLTEQLADGGSVEGCTLEQVPHFQVLLSPITAEDLGLSVGARMVLSADTTDPLYFGVPGESLRDAFVMSVSGIAEFDDPALEYWYGDPSLHRPAIQQNADLRIVRATGLVSPDQYEPMLNALGEASWGYVWRHFVDPNLLTTGDIEAIRDDLTSFQQLHTPVAVLPGKDRAFTQLPDLIGEHIGQRRESLGFMAMTVAGLLLVLAAGTLMLAVVFTERQRRSIVLARSRGASGAQLGWTRLCQGLLLTIPAVAVGFLVTRWRFPKTDDTIPLGAAVATVVVATSFVSGALLPLAKRPLGALRGEPDNRPSPSAVLVVIDVLVAVVAIGAVLTLRRSGQVEPSLPDDGFSPLVAITPGLLALALGWFASRVQPIVSRGLGWLGARGRDLVPFLGFRLARGNRPVNRLPILVLVLCVATGTLAAMLRSSIVDGQETQSWHEVGADFAVQRLSDGSPLPLSLDFSSAPGVDDAVLATVFPRARATIGSRTADIRMMAVDADAYQQTTSGTAGDVHLPESMLAPGRDETTETSALPVIVSAQWPIDFRPRPGDTFSVDMGAVDPVMVVTEVRDHYPGIAPDESFVVVDSDALETLLGDEIPPTVAYLWAPGAAEPGIAGFLREQPAELRLVSRHQTLQSLAADPFVSWVKIGLLLVIVFSMVLAVITAVSSLTLGATARRRHLGYLRAMGLASGQVLKLTITEHLPVLALGTVVGALTGIWTIDLLAPVLGVDLIVAGTVPVVVRTDWSLIAVMIGSLFLAATVAVVIFVGVHHRRAVTDTLRMGEE